MKVLFLLLICWLLVFQGNSCGISGTNYEVKDYKKYIIGTWASFDDIEGYRDKPSKLFVIFKDDGTIVVDYSPLERELGKKIIQTSRYEFITERIIKTTLFSDHLLIVPSSENKLHFTPEVISRKAELEAEMIYATAFKRVK